MESRFRAWQQEAGLTNERVCNLAREQDPDGKGITIRALTNFKRTGSCHLKTALLLMGAFGPGSGTWPVLSWGDLDVQGILERRGD